MNEFERARLKHAKNKERRERVNVPVEAKPVNGVEHERLAPTLPVPKDKQHISDGLITVTVTLPNEVMEFSFTKPNVLQNVPINKLRRVEIMNALRKGLEPVFGGLK